MVYPENSFALDFPFDKIARLHPTAYYRTKNSITDTLLKVLRKEGGVLNF